MLEPLRPEDPDRIGSYRLLARLGAGGMGVVYLGRSPGGRTVAVKVIRERFAADPEYRARFRREVTAAGQVTATVTAPVLDAAPEAAAPWLVTAYLPGLSLREAVTGFGALPPDTLRVLAAGLAEALTDIHRVGIAHRDLKPGNVMLTAEGPRVIDFGIARPEDGTAITLVGTIIGTPGFMSPEQAAGGVVGPAGDIFSAGAVLAFAATGREPFGADGTAATLRRVEQVQADLGGITDPWLLGIITACLHRDPARRPTAAALLDRVGAAPSVDWLPAPLAERIDRRTAAARHIPQFADAEEPSRTEVMGEATADPVTPVPRSAPNRRHLLIGGTALAATVAGVVFLRRDEPDVPEANRPPTPTPPPTTTSAPPPQAIRRWQRKVSDYYPDVFTAGGVVLAKSQEDELHALDPRTGRVLWTKPATLIGVVTNDRVFVAENINPRLLAVDPPTGKTRWSYQPPFSEIIIRLADNGSVTCFGYQKIRAVHADTGRPRWTAAVDTQGGIAAGGDLVAALSETELTGLDADSGRIRWKYPIKDGFYLAIGDSHAFAVDANRTLHAVRTDTGKPAWRKAGFTFSSPVPSGKTLFANGGRGEVFALDAATGSARWSRGLDQDTVLSLAGSTLHVVSTDNTLHALHTTDGRTRWTYEADLNKKSGPAVTAGLVFVGTRAGTVEAITPPDGDHSAGS